MELDPAWYDAIAARRSRRRYSDRPVATAALEALRAHCAASRLTPGAHVELAEQPGDLYTDVAGRPGDVGRVEGAPWAAAFVAPTGNRIEAGYVGEAFVLAATNLGLGTCWVATGFDPDAAARVFAREPGEQVVAVTPVGHPLEHKQVEERMMSAAVRSAARRQVDEIAPGLTRGEGPAGAAWPAWAVSAVEAARLAPSAADRQPWRFRLASGALVLSTSGTASLTASIDLGIAMLHAELGALHAGVRGFWEHLPAPDVARFTPDGD
ncbi:MAG: nitroreductase family protein [Thermoleophilia bacterium]